MMVIGRSTVAAGELQAFVERMERLNAEKKQVSADLGEVAAEAKARGFEPKVIRHVIKRRAMKPHDRQELDALVETYLHALGELSETPLHRIVAGMARDTASREAVIEALKAFVPDNGSITVELGGKPLRLARDEAGEVSVTEVEPRPASAEPKPARMERGPAKPVPDVTGGVAFDMGREAFKANEPIIANPFPFGHANRPRWDEGWRKESGTDGMGPGGGE